MTKVEYKPVEWLNAEEFIERYGKETIVEFTVTNYQKMDYNDRDSGDTRKLDTITIVDGGNNVYNLAIGKVNANRLLNMGVKDYNMLIQSKIELTTEKIKFQKFGSKTLITIVAIDIPPTKTFLD